MGKKETHFMLDYFLTLLPLLATYLARLPISPYSTVGRTNQSLDSKANLSLGGGLIIK